MIIFNPVTGSERVTATSTSGTRGSTSDLNNELHTVIIVLIVSQRTSNKVQTIARQETLWMAYSIPRDRCRERGLVYLTDPLSGIIWVPNDSLGTRKINDLKIGML